MTDAEFVESLYDAEREVAGILGGEWIAPWHYGE